jgi:serine/threonine protein kinase
MTLGTPDEAAWPGVTSLPEFQQDVFPKWRPRPLRDVVPALDAQGLDLLSRMLTYDPQQRVTARMALRHSYFADIPQILDDPPRL